MPVQALRQALFAGRAFAATRGTNILATDEAVNISAVRLVTRGICGHCRNFAAARAAAGVAIVYDFGSNPATGSAARVAITDNLGSNSVAGSAVRPTARSLWGQALYHLYS